MDSMRTRWLGVGCLVGIFMVMSSGMAIAQAVTIDFEAGPGPDGELGTADDVALTEGTAIGAAKKLTQAEGQLLIDAAQEAISKIVSYPVIHQGGCSG